MSKLMFVGDVHIADKAPGGRVDDYRAAIICKLQTIGKMCAEQNIDRVIFLGDIFHDKRASRARPNLIQELQATFNQYPCQIDVVPGNHDMGPAGLSSVMKDQPLGVLVRGSQVHLLTGIDESQDYWLIGRPYDSHKDDNPGYYSMTVEELDTIQAGERKPRILAAHGSLLEPGGIRPFPHVPVEQVPNVLDYDLVAAGHIHENLGMHEFGNAENKCIFANVGSISRVARTQANYLRTLQVLVVAVQDKAPIEITSVEIPGVVPALEVFGKDEVKERAEPSSDSIRKFIDSLKNNTTLDVLSIPEIIASLPDDLEQEVKDLVQYYVEATP